MAERIASSLVSEEVDIEELKYYESAIKMLSVQEDILKGDLSNFSYDKKIEDLEPYDFIFFGSFSGKKFIIYNTCRMVAIKTLERMESKIQSKGGKVIKKETFKGLFKIKASKVDNFTQELNQELLKLES